MPIFRITNSGWGGGVSVSRCVSFSYNIQRFLKLDDGGNKIKWPRKRCEAVVKRNIFIIMRDGEKEKMNINKMFFWFVSYLCRKNKWLKIKKNKNKKVEKSIIRESRKRYIADLFIKVEQNSREQCNGERG